MENVHGLREKLRRRNKRKEGRPKTQTTSPKLIDNASYEPWEPLASAQFAAPRVISRDFINIFLSQILELRAAHCEIGLKKKNVMDELDEIVFIPAGLSL